MHSTAGYPARESVILIIDDDPTNLAIITEYLNDSPYTLLVAEDGEKGLKRAEYVRPDLILLDIMMPGIDGYETCRRLKAADATRDIPVIFMTALTEIEHKVRGFAAGAVDYIVKPSQREEVLARVGVHLRIRELTSRLTEANESLEKRVEERTAELKNSERRLADIIDFLPDATFAIDLEGKIILWNRAAEVITGVKAADMLGKNNYEHALPFYRVRRPVLVDLVLKPVAEVERLYSQVKIENGHVSGESYTYCSHDQMYMLGMAAPLYDSAGRVVGAIEAIRDITERKRAEEEHVRLATALEQAAEAIFISGTDWVIQYVNPAFEKMSGYPRHEIIGRHTSILRPDGHDPAWYENYQEKVGRGEVWTGHLAARRKDGTCYEAEVTVSPIRDKEHTIINYVYTHRDITHEIKLERELRQAQKMEAIGTLAAGIAHDFNNILTAIVGFTQMALFKIPENNPGRRDMEKVLASSSRATELVRQILTFSRQSDQGRKTVHLITIIDEVMKLLRSSLPTTIEIRRVNSIAPDRDLISADPTQLHQVIMNLCTNADHAMRAGGGTLSIELTEVEIDASLVTRYRNLTPGPYIRLTVSDTGHGMDAAVMERIFDPYFTTKEPGEGTGMGLAMVQGIVKSHGGAITVYSEVGQGTTFQVFLPMIAGAEEQAKAAPEPIPGGHERILFIDDEQVLVELGRDMLESLGYSVTVTTSSLDAFVLFRQRPEAFDLIVTDLTMPGLTGRLLAKKILAIRPDMPIILCTGFSESIRGKQLESNIRDVLMKPYHLAVLAKMVRKVLDENLENM